MDHPPERNPYLPPTSELNQGVRPGAPSEPADRSARLGAATLDGLLIVAPLVPAVIAGGYQGVRQQARAQAVVMEGGDLSALDGPIETGMVVFAAAMVLGVLAVLAIVVYQWILISRTGQTLGKRWTGIRIERIDGKPISFGSGVVIRNWIPKLIGSVPGVGALFQLVDLLFIFREDRRCLHDHMAGTRVVRHR